jgi:hypothetical protein
MIPLWYAWAWVRLIADRVAGVERDERGAIDNVIWYALIAAGVVVVVGIFVAKMKSKAEATPTE